MATKDTLGDRMKRHETTTQLHLLRRTPVIARIDGRSFHTFTKQFKQYNDPELPFSEFLHTLMIFTTQELVKKVQGCVLGYTQSDEISLLLRDWDTIDTQAFFDYNVQKLTSLMGSIASNAFNFSYRPWANSECVDDLAQFDARVFNLPKEEVVNYFIWRQQDATRNSIQMLGHHHFSPKQMHGKNNNEVQEMLITKKDINWNNIPAWMKRGSVVTRNGVDDIIPIFTQYREYIEQHLVVEEFSE